MGRGLNEVNLIGRIQPNDPELRYTQSGQAVCNFKMVTDESYKDRDGNMVERSEWHSIVFWGKAGEIINQYMKKGRQIYVKGRLQTRKYEDREGQTRYVTEIVGTDFVFIDGGSPDSGGGSQEYSQVPSHNEGAAPRPSQQPTQSSPVEEDDLPF